jgi:hypothetical protein
MGVSFSLVARCARHKVVERRADAYPCGHPHPESENAELMPRRTTAPSRRAVAVVAVIILLQGIAAVGGLAASPTEQVPQVAAAADDLLVDLELQAVSPQEAAPVEQVEQIEAYLLDLPASTVGSQREVAEDMSAAMRGSAAIFAEEFPAHAAATQDPADPATTHWAVIIGVNDYEGRVGNTFGSVPDALVLRQILLDRGWRDDHILLLTDRAASHDRIVRAIEWLERSTDERSTVVFSKSGHIRHSGGRTGLWPANNQYLWAEDFGRMIGAVRADKMWISLQGCHAAGMSAPGVEGPGRVVTYSSPVTQKSFEDPETGHSLQGFYMFVEGIRDGWGDADGDGRVSVQEAHAFGAPRAEIRSAGQQSPVMVDGLGGRPFHLDVR